MRPLVAWHRIAAVGLVLATSACVTPTVPSTTAPVLEGKAAEHSRMVQVRNTWLRVHEEGEGAQTAVLFIHGYGSRLEGWRVVQPGVSAGRRTISFDQRGFGLSERTEGIYGPEGHAADALALLDELGVQRVVVVGHSYGAGVALRLAMRHPERVAGVLLVSPFALEQQVPAQFRWARTPGVGEYLFSTSYRDFPGEKYLLAFHEPERFVSVAALDEVGAQMAREGSTYAALATARGMDYAAIEAGYSTIERPITVVWGEADRVTPIRTLPAFAEKLPRATFVRVPACGHMPSWEKPDAVINALSTLLARVDAETAAPPAEVLP